MPLELFDNYDYEAHSPEEWLELGAEEGVRAGQGGGEWGACSGLTLNPVSHHA